MSIARDEAGAAAAAALVSVKAVPGAKRDEVVGRLGERLKIRVSAPPEDGKANRAIFELLARELGISAKAVSVVRGVASAEKVVHVEGVSAATIEARWA